MSDIYIYINDLKILTLIFKIDPINDLKGQQPLLNIIYFVLNISPLKL